MKSITSSETIKCLLQVFSRFGYPKVLVSDNGRQFISDQFQHFLKERGINQRLSAPYHPASNGAAERMVRTIKEHLGKVLDQQNVDTEEAIAELLMRVRSLPTRKTNKSPAEILLGRQLRDRLKIIHENNQDSQKSFVHKNKFKTGQKVAYRVYNNPRIKWNTGTITEVLGPRNVNIQSNGEIFKRHVDQVRNVGPAVNITPGSDKPQIQKAVSPQLPFTNDNVSLSNPPELRKIRKDSTRELNRKTRGIPPIRFKPIDWKKNSKDKRRGRQ